MVSEVLRQIREVPEYLIALKATVAILVSGLPIYAGLWYFLHRRGLKAHWGFTFNFIGVFALTSGLAFLFASPLASLLHPAILTTYLFITCVVTALSIVALIDLFVVQHYLSNVKKLYISPPVRSMVKVVIFCVAILPILRFVLHFNPLTLIAIPTIATAAVAFAMQDTFKALIAGINLGSMIRIGEWIAFQNKEGRVVDINWARTVIATMDGQRIFIPNTLLQTGVFANFTGGSPANQVSFKISVSYEASPMHVKETLLHSLESVPGVALSPPPQAFLLDYADSGVVYALNYSIDDYTQRMQIQDTVATRIWFEFQKQGISRAIPLQIVQVKTQQVVRGPRNKKDKTK